MLAPQRYPYGDATPKARAFAAAARGLDVGEVSHPPLAVAFKPLAGGRAAPRQPVAPGAPNLHGQPRVTCRLCGECDVGCNDGAKQSLDHTYLSVAWDAGARIRTGCEAVALRAGRDGAPWEVDYVQRVELREGVPEHLLDPDAEARRRSVRAPVVVLAAGTFGSTRLLLRNRAALPGLSPRLGEGVSANGDMIAFAFRTREPMDPSRGPVITTTLRVPGDESSSGREYLVQDAGSPVFAEWLWHLRETPGDLLRLRHTVARRAWERLRGRRDTDLGGELAEGLGDAHDSASMLPLLAMGRDRPTGRLTLRGDELDLAYRAHDSAAHYAAADDACRAITQALGGRYFTMEKLRTTTVHPLGGCGMGRSWREGVVDDHGEVFGHRGLFVCDGSILPGAVGANPSLTIAAVAERCTARMRERLPAKVPA
jgi:cholesterol oxidase